MVIRHTAASLLIAIGLSTSPAAAQFGQPIELNPEDGRTQSIVSSTGQSLGLKGFNEAPLINNRADLLLHVNWETGIGPQDRIYRADEFGLQTEIVRTEPNVPDPMHFESFSRVRFNNDGDAAFFADRINGTRTVQVSTGGASLAQVTDTASGTAENFVDLKEIALGDGGDIVVEGDTGPLVDDAVAIGNATGIQTQVFGGTLGSLGGVSINADGLAAWRRVVSQPAPNDGLQIGPVNGSFESVIDAEDPVLGGNEQALETISDPVINDNGVIAFRSTLVGFDDDDNIVPINAGIYTIVDGPSTFKAAFFSGGTLRNAGGTVPDDVSAFSAPAINAAGDIAFALRANGTTRGDLNDTQLLKHPAGETAGTAFVIATENEPTPDGDRRFGDLTGPAILESGAIAFNTNLRDAMGDPAGTGLYLADELDTLDVAETGDLNGDWRIVALNFAAGQDVGGRAGVNDFGQVAYEALEQSETTGESRRSVYVFTPDLEWREGVEPQNPDPDGAWDDSENWTLNLDPAAVHDVAIHTLEGATVEGPTSNVTVKSLYLNNQFGSTNVLSLKHDATLTVNDDLVVGSRGSITHMKGALIAGTFTNDGTYLQNGATALAAGGLLNTDLMQIEGTAIFGIFENGPVAFGVGGRMGDAVPGQVINDGRFIIGDDAEVYVASDEFSSVGLINRSEFDLLGGDLVGSLANEFGAQASAHGRIEGELNNFGRLDVTGPLTVTGMVRNFGEIEIGELEALRGGGTERAGVGNDLALNGEIPPAVWENEGELQLAGGVIEPLVGLRNAGGGRIEGHGTVGAATFFVETYNEGGVIHANVPDESLTFTSLATNVEGGQILIDAGATMRTIASPNSIETEGLLNRGEIALRGEGAEFIGEAVVSYGTIHGQGRVAADLVNHGVLRAEDGRLTVSGEFATNGPAILGGGDGSEGVGRIVVENNATLVAIQGLQANSGHIALAGGEFDNNGQDLTNTDSGVIGGWGTLRAGTVHNAGLIDFADQDTDVFAHVNNTGRIEVEGNTTTVFGNITNDTAGTINVNNGELRVFGNLVNDGAIVTDPTVIEVNDFINGETGYVVSDPGDRFVIHGDLQSSSTEDLKWSTGGAVLAFEGGALHEFSLTGDDLGPTVAGLSNNFAWGTLELAAGESLVLADANGGDAGDAALYLSRLALDGGLEQLALIDSAGLNIYYDPARAVNDYLDAETYELNGGGFLQPIPEPTTLALLALGGLPLAGRRARRRNRAPRAV